MQSILQHEAGNPQPNTQSTPQHIHILGICGTFMGGIALIARAAGYRVTGCDANVYPPMSTQLQEQGIALIEGYDPSQLDLNADIYVVGNAVSRGNPLLEAILDRGLNYVSGPQWLSEQVLCHKWVLAVAGTHGKTTTTSMLTWILEHAGLNPGFLIGGVPGNFGLSARLTESNFFVIEADEYDTAFCDKRSKFVHYRPRTAVLNNLEYDHADIFADLSAIETQFHHLVRTIPQSGRVLCNGGEPALKRVLAKGCWSKVEFFNDTEQWQARLCEGDLVEFLQAGKVVANAHLTLPGQHNADNALAALLAARHVGVTPEQAGAALSEFHGVKRRLEVRGTVRGVTVYDDFAHHPTAIEATLAALRRRVGDGVRIFAVLEPRSNTMKLGAMKDRLVASLHEAAHVFCYSKGLGWDADAALASLNERSHVHDDIEKLIADVRLHAREGDHVLVMSNGGFENVHQRLLQVLA